MRSLAFGVSLLLLVVIAGCDDDDDSTIAPGGATDFMLTVENVSPSFSVGSSGAFDTPVGGSSPAPIAPGGAYEFAFTAAPGSKLSLAAMFVQSNDAFYGPDEAGIELFDTMGMQRTGDMTASLALWDAGTEQNEQPGIGLNQAPRQAGGNTGAADADNTVRLLDDAFTYPDVADGVQLTLTSTSATGFVARLENVGTDYAFTASGAFDTPVGATMPGPIGPGAAYQIDFDAAPGSKLSFATMFIPSNDFFFAPDADGIDLYDSGDMPASGDVTSQVSLWDAGTEVDQEPGLGADQPQRSGGTGAADANTMVRMAADAFGNLPAVSDVLQATLTSMGGTSFRLRLENVSTIQTLPTSDAQTQAVPLSPGAWVVHGAPAPLFEVGSADRGDGLETIAEDGDPSTAAASLANDTGLTVIVSPGAWVVHTGTAPIFSSGEADRGEGLEAVAEDGDPSMLSTELAASTGVTVPFAPGVWVVHEGGMPLFTDGMPDRGDGLEGLAEDGDPAPLAAAVATLSATASSGVFNTPLGAGSPAPIGPGQRYQVMFTAEPGDMLSFATMFIESNDLFLAPADAGVALFDASNNAVTGEVTSAVELWDAGTEVNEEPGVGPNQAPRQSGANVGADENGNVRVVDDAFTYPEVSALVRVILSTP